MKFKMIAAAVAASAVAAPALAADLPSVEPVDYVQTCDAFGAGFFVLPGKDTCVRVSGRVRTELRVENFADNGNWGNGVNADGDPVSDMGFFARGYVRLDARTQTEIGLVRSYTSLSMNANNGNSGIYFESAYVQVGGFFVGRDYSQYDVWTGDMNATAVDRSLSDTVTWSATYTKNLGSGLTGWIGIESSDERDMGGKDGGLPAVIGGFGYNQGWGSLNLHGAIKEVKADGPGFAESVDGELGYAIQGTAKFNLDMLSAGSSIVFQAAYTDGALSYVGARNNDIDFDGIVNANGDIETTTAYSLGIGAIFQVTETVSLRAEGTYLDVDGYDDYGYDRYAVAGSVDWTPAEGLRVAGVLSHADTNAKEKALGGFEDTRFTLRVQHDF